MDDLELVRGTDNPFADRQDPAAASKALKAEILTAILGILRERDLGATRAGEIAGISRSQMSRIRNGRISSISLDVLVNVLDALSGHRAVVHVAFAEPATARA